MELSSHDEEGNSLSLSEIIPDEKLVTDEIELKDEKSYLIKAIEKSHSYNLVARSRKSHHLA